MIILLLQSDLKWCIHLSRSILYLSLFFNKHKISFDSIAYLTASQKALDTRTHYFCHFCNWLTWPRLRKLWTPVLIISVISVTDSPDRVSESSGHSYPSFLSFRVTVRVLVWNPSAVISPHGPHILTRQSRGSKMYVFNHNLKNEVNDSEWLQNSCVCHFLCENFPQSVYHALERTQLVKITLREFFDDTLNTKSMHIIVRWTCTHNFLMHQASAFKLKFYRLWCIKWNLF